MSPAGDRRGHQLAVADQNSQIHIHVSCGGMEDLVAYVDQGAAISLMDNRFVQRSGLEISPYVGPKLSGADNVPLQMRRRVFTDIQMNEQGVMAKLDFEPGVIANLPEGVDLILGLDVLR